MVDWKEFKRVIKKIKQLFFYKKIQEIASRKKRPLDLINWVQKCKLPAIIAQQFNRWLCIKLEDIWQVLYYMFNSAQNQLSSKLINQFMITWWSTSKAYLWVAIFFKIEFRDVIKKYNSLSMSESNYILWHHFKILTANDKFVTNFINIANKCINLSYLLLHFKMFLPIIIPKPTKMAYNSLKAFWPIVLFNMLGKCIKKIISERLQVQSISSNFVHPNQLGGLKQQSTTDTGLYLIHLICTRWVKGLYTSTLVFDIAQFFPSLNYILLPMILNKAGFDSRISSFFSNYLINRKTQYIWNNFVSSSFRADIGVG